MSNAPNAAAFNNINNALLAYARIREAQASGESLRATREATRLQTEQNASKVLREQQESNLRTQAEGIFGTKYDPEMEPALAAARTMQVEPRLFKPGVPNVPPTVIGTTGSAAPGGMPSLVTRPATGQDIEASIRRGGVGIRESTAQRGRALGLPEGHPLLTEFATSPQLILPGQAQEIITKSAQGRQEQTKAEVAEKTKEDAIAKLQAESREAKSKAAKSQLDLEKEEAQRPYYESNAYNESLKKHYEALEQKFLVEQQPDRAKEQRLKIEKLDGDIIKNNQDIAKQEYILNLNDAYRRTTDPAAREEISRRIAVANGQTPQLMTYDLAAQKAGLDANVEALRARATGKAHFAKKEYEEGRAAYNVANMHSVAAAKINKSPTVELVIPQKIGGYVWGEYEPKTARVKTKIGPAEMYVNGEIDAIAAGTLQKPTGDMVRLEPGLDVQPEYYDQADALAWKIYYDNLPIATNTAELTKVLGNYNAPPDVKERALRKIQVMTQEYPASMENTPQNQPRGLVSLTPEERAVPRTVIGTVSQPTRGFAAPPASAASQLPPGTTVGLPPSQQYTPPAKLKRNVEEDRKQFDPLARDAAKRHGIDPELFSRLIQAESQFNPNAVSKKGAVGLAQLMPDTARDLKVDPKDPRQNLEGGARYLRQLLDRYGGDMRKALIAYNWGMGNLATGQPVPQETEAYVSTVMR